MRALSFLLVVSLSAPLAAEPDEFGWAYLVDGGALPFVWGTGLVALSGVTLLHPPKEPRLFPSDEGGAPVRDETVPTYVQNIGIGVMTVAVAAVPTEARWNHFKGFLQTLATSAALTELAKNGFGRRRPTFTAGATEDDARRSFWSGHASSSWGVATYVGLYAQKYWFGGSELHAWEVLPLAALAGLATYVPYTRVRDNRHHLSDVLVGSAVGAAIATGFFLFQERRVRRDGRAGGGDVQLGVAGPSLTLSGTF